MEQQTEQQMDRFTTMKETGGVSSSDTSTEVVSTSDENKVRVLSTNTVYTGQGPLDSRGKLFIRVCGDGKHGDCTFAMNERLIIPVEQRQSDNSTVYVFQLGPSDSTARSKDPHKITVTGVGWIATFSIKVMSKDPKKTSDLMEKTRKTDMEARDILYRITQIDPSDTDSVRLLQQEAIDLFAQYPPRSNAAKSIGHKRRADTSLASSMDKKS
jgi:hypothetical protein